MPFIPLPAAASDQTLFAHLPFSLFAATAPKPSEEESCRNEDVAGAVVFRDTDPWRLAVAIADGAGGAGLYCRDWAQLLIERLPPDPLTDIAAINSWITEIWESFYSEHRELAKDDPIKSRKFLQEGSYSTLCAVWLRPATSEEDGDRRGYFLDAIACGDSCLFLATLGTRGLCDLKLLGPPAYADPSEFDKSPVLLNWKSELIMEATANSPWFCQKWLAPNQALILATDALSHGLKTSKRALARFTRLRRHQMTSEQFRRFCYHEHNAGRLRHDDYTLVLIEPTTEIRP